MFSYTTVLHLKDTDATGVIFFPQQLSLCLETLEKYLFGSDYSFKGLMKAGFYMPVVQCHAQYLSSIEVNDELKITMQLSSLGRSSFCLDFALFNLSTQSLAGKAQITHVLTLQATRKSTPIPEQMRSFLNRLHAISS